MSVGVAASISPVPMACTRIGRPGAGFRWSSSTIRSTRASRSSSFGKISMHQHGRDGYAKAVQHWTPRAPPSFTMSADRSIALAEAGRELNQLAFGQAGSAHTHSRDE